MKVRILLALAVLATLCGHGAAVESQGDCYMPGAIVTLAVDIEAPDQWILNPQVPLRMKFADSDSEDFRISQDSYDFKVGKDSHYTAEIPIKISPSYTAEQLNVPLELACSICTLDESSCTFVNENVNVKLRVQREARGDVKPQKKGVLRTTHQLIPPM